MKNYHHHGFILTIVLKELHQHLISFRFVVCFILSVILIGVSIYYRSTNYSKRLKEYNIRGIGAGAL